MRFYPPLLGSNYSCVRYAQATKISRLPLPARGSPGGGGGGDSPYSPGSSDFGDLFEPPAPLGKKRDNFDSLFDKPNRRKNKSNSAKVPVKFNKKKGEWFLSFHFSFLELTF